MGPSTIISTDGTFSNLTTGKYCVAVAYSGKGEVGSSCVGFSVVNRRKVTVPVR